MDRTLEIWFCSAGYRKAPRPNTIESYLLQSRFVKSALDVVQPPNSTIQLLQSLQEKPNMHLCIPSCTLHCTFGSCLPPNHPSQSSSLRNGPSVTLRASRPVSGRNLGAVTTASETARACVTPLSAKQPQHQLLFAAFPATLLLISKASS